MMTGQSKIMSWVEACINVLIGYGVALATQLTVFPLFGLTVTFVQNIWIGMVFTVVSLIRSYVLRRFFNWLHVR